MYLSMRRMFSRSTCLAFVLRVGPPLIITKEEPRAVRESLAGEASRAL